MQEEPEHIEEQQPYPENGNGNGHSEPSELTTTLSISGMYENWFLDYASYVIMERAVPEMLDGLKPVQRRILHAMKELDDGRYNKVANIIGHTMKYHPHGDASIGDALVQLGQKELLIDTQGNWGNTLTGDDAAAPRYIEARLSKFALEVAFNPKTTQWKLSYDGRNKEPITLPVKFPLLLAQGAEGIAVGLASKILPHNFIELLEACIAILQEKEVQIFPDFPGGGTADFSKYNDGQRGGRVRVRARISQLDKKTLVITEIPFGTTTSSLIDTIIAANDKGKIKVRKIEDNTAENVEILIHLAPGVSPDQTIDALYAFSDCEISISPNCCVIDEGKPVFVGVTDVLKKSVKQTVHLLKRELEIQLGELEEQWHFASLERIFIEKRIYRQIEKCETWESVIETIDNGLKPYAKMFYREITRDDIIRLTEIKIKRISKYDSDRAENVIKSIEDDIADVKEKLAHLIEYAIAWYEKILKKYGKGRERRTEIRNFEVIEATMVAAATQKLYVNKTEGFAGTSLKRDEYVCDCSDIDDIIVFRADGTFIVTRVAEKVFVGQDVVHIQVFKKNDERTIYNLVYRDGKAGAAYVKRFPVVGIVRDKEYNLTKEKQGSRVLYFSANPNGEAEIIQVRLKPKPKLKKLLFEYDFSQLAVKSRSSQGNILTKHQVSKIWLKEDGISTLGARDIWFDDSVQRLNVEQRGVYLGAFSGDDKIIVMFQSGEYKLYSFDLSTHFDENILEIRKFDPDTIWTAVYRDGALNQVYVKRFTAEPTEKKQSFITDHPGSFLYLLTAQSQPVIELKYSSENKPRNRDTDVISLFDFIDVKSYKARGKRLTQYGVNSIVLIPSEESEMPSDGLHSSTDAVEPDTVEIITESENKTEELNVINAEEQSVLPSETDAEPEVETTIISEEQTEKKQTATEKPIEHKTTARKDSKKPKPITVSEAPSPINETPPVTPIIPLPLFDIDVPEEKKNEKKTKTAKSTKHKPQKKDEKENILTVRLDKDEPLQMEFDF